MPDLEARRHHYEARAEWPLTGAALLFLAAYAWPILDPVLASNARSLCRTTTQIAWALFAADYLVRLMLSEDRLRFVRRHLLDLVVVVLPLLRPLRLLRLVTLLSVLNRYMSDNVRGRVITYVAGSTVLLVLLAGLAVLDAERRAPDPNITGFADAVWWALTTVTTVGYGDRYPTTGEGRMIAAGLMLGGIALLGTVTASIAAWLVQRVAEVEETSQAATAAHVEQLRLEIAALREDLRRTAAPPGGPPSAL